MPITSDAQATALAKQLANAISFQPEEADTEPRRVRHLKYWRMCQRPNCQRHRSAHGWITVGPDPQTDPYEAQRYERSKHMTQFDDAYGIEEVGGDMTDGMARFRPFLNAGGLQLFPGEQVFSYAWHEIPLVRQSLSEEQEAVVGALEMQVVECEYGCFDFARSHVRRFANTGAYSSHIKAMHPEVAGPVAVGRKIEEAFSRRAVAEAEAPPAPVAPIMGQEFTRSLAQMIVEFEQERARAVAATVEPAKQPGNPRVIKSSSD